MPVPAQSTCNNFRKHDSVLKGFGTLLRWLVVIAFIASLSRYLQFLHVSGDSVALIGEVDRILNCIRGGQWFGWGGQFPLLQKIPALVLRLVGASNQTILTCLSGVSFIVFIHLLAWSWKDLRKTSRNLAIFFVAVLVSGPLLWYGRSSFGEMLAAFFTLGFVISCRENSSAVKIFSFFVLAGISKDTAFPFLLILGLMGSALGPQISGGIRFRRPRWGVLAAGCVTAAVINGGFNYLKFGSVLNLAYLNPQFIVQTWKDQLSFFLGIWFSPNGGVLFFWPSFFLLIFLVSRHVAKEVLSEHGDKKQKFRVLLPLGVVIFVLLALTFGFSRWFAPMGWVCWGPRLLLPWLPAAGYLLITAYSEKIIEWLSYVRQKKWRYWLLRLTWGVASFGQFVVLFRPNLMDPLFTPDDMCPKIAYIQKDAAYYYHCINHGLWTKKSVLLDAYSPGAGATAFIFSLAWCICLIWFLSLMRKEELNREVVCRNAML